jgi:hypothetical protein
MTYNIEAYKTVSISRADPPILYYLDKSDPRPGT